MRSTTRLLTILAAFATCSSAADPSQLYRDVVKPALEQQCLGCHGVGNTFGKLDLRTREAALKGGGRGAAVVPGAPGRSLLYTASAHEGELTMPPGGAEKMLPDDTLAAMREWIAGGAPFAEGETAQSWDFAEEDIWAFRPLRQVAPPSDGTTRAS